MHAETGNAISIRFALPSASLAPYVTTYYCTEVVASPSEPMLEDLLHPEWPNLRFMEQDGWAHSAIGDEPVTPTPAFSATGPTSQTTRFQVTSGRSWGIGLMPLGWAAFVDGHASDYADTVSDAMADHAFAAFQPLAHELTSALADNDSSFGDELAIIERHMDALVPAKSPASTTIAAINTALVDPELATVADLAERVEMNIRSLERLTKRAFGFTPKLLLRRQRFLRSLSQFMLDPSLKWLSTLDYHYHDQAHFVRDFKRFMGMSPSAYAALDKPFLVAAARARMEIAGKAVQGLHDPTA